MAIAAALTLNHATDLFANTLVMHCLSLMHSRGNNVIYDIRAFAIKRERKERVETRAKGRVRIACINKVRVIAALSCLTNFAITMRFKRPRRPAQIEI